MNNNIILTGLMGAGKTTVGLLLAKTLSKYTFVDTDSVIEKHINMSIIEFFNQFSEREFRKIEKSIIKNVLINKNKIISIGGGAFEDSELRNLLLNSGIVFYLKASPEKLFERVKNTKKRPLLLTPNPIKTLRDLLSVREINYLKANYTIDTDFLSPYNIVKTITERINEHTD